MNSDSLKKDNKSIYCEFFNKYDLIISSPIHFSIAGSSTIFSKGNGGLITQKIPLRNYIGINFSDTEKTIEFIYKNSSNEDFQKGNIENFYPVNRGLLNTLGLDFSIGFLSEYNWSDSPSIISDILIAILIIRGEIDIDGVIKLDLSISEYKDVLKKVLDLDKDLIDNFGFFSSARSNSNFIGSCILKSNSHILTIENSGFVQYYNMGNQYDFSQIDLTICILNSNLLIRNKFSPRALVQDQKSLENNLKDREIPCDNLDIIKGIEYLSIYYSLKIYEDMKYLYEESPSGGSFFKNAFSYREAMKCIFNNVETDNIHLKNLSKCIYSNFPNNNLNLYVDQTGIAGASKFLIMSNKTGYFNTEFIEKINTEIGLNLSLDYSSHYDGFERDGIRVEQYKSKGIYSDFSSNILVKKFIDKKITTFNIDSLDVKSFGNGLIFDSINKNIYLDGVSLTSKDILSKTYTIEIFGIFLKNWGKDVNNSLLPVSSYSKNKNEFLGKIILPLNKFLKENLGKSIEINCNGSIYDFSVLFINSEIEIYFIQKV